jgi:hypothetical protein
MKKSFIILGFSFLAFNTSLKAQNVSAKTQATFEIQNEPGTESLTKDSTYLAEIANLKEANLLNSRLNQINEMDKSNLGFAEKRQLRKEVRTINKSLEQNNGGIYISVGAVIIILLLLIILL